jgi:hypothetical protein
MISRTQNQILLNTGFGFLVLFASLREAAAEPVYLRANQVDYQPSDPKIAIAFGDVHRATKFQIIENSPNGRTVFEGSCVRLNQSWRKFERHELLDFSGLKHSGIFRIKLGAATSLPFRITGRAYDEVPIALLDFMREQRCGYNPWVDAVCHPFDGRTAFGPNTNGTYLDATGGWHDAADLLKYLLTSGNATAQMLLAYQLAKEEKPGAPAGFFEDRCNALGQPGKNGVPDILDEATWGLKWMLKLHPTRDALYHQVADDRDHAGRRLPQNESIDYGWGKGGARVVYYADGRPQGLLEYKSESTGLANLAGRYAAAMGLAFQIFKDDPEFKTFADECLKAGLEVYELGRAHEGVQQGNSYKAPYRYEESTWSDDMEWGAAELYRATGQKHFLDQARRYARLAGSDTWMGKEQTHHYQYYPFMNVGHSRLYPLVDKKNQRELAQYYREGIERCVSAGQHNPFRIGVPFIWCSNNLVAALVTQCLMYERMTPDRQFHAFALAQRDWLFGRNPWGYTMFTGVGSVFPRDPHLMTMQLTGRMARGGLVDGPVYERIFKSLKGVSITEPDPLASFQGPAVYHDDQQDYSSNEPTMDGTASVLLMLAVCH